MGTTRNDMNAFKYPGIPYLAALGIISFFLLAGLPDKIIFSVELKVNKPDIAMVYFDTGGVSESNTSKASLLAKGDYEPVEFVIPATDLKTLRLDPMTNPGSFLIRSMHI